MLPEPIFNSKFSAPFPEGNRLQLWLWLHRVKKQSLCSFTGIKKNWDSEGNPLKFSIATVNLYRNLVPVLEKNSLCSWRKSIMCSLFANNHERAK